MSHNVVTFSRLVDYIVTFLKPMLPSGTIFVILLRTEAGHEIICF